MAVLALRAPRRPRLAQLAFLVVAAFLIFSKVWSQQFVLWLLPLVVLARPRWGAFLAWQLAEVCYFAAFYGELLGAATSRPVFPEGVFVLAVDAATGHRGGAVRAWSSGRSCTRSSDAVRPDLRRRPGRRRPRRRTRRPLARPASAAERSTPEPEPAPASTPDDRRQSRKTTASPTSSRVMPSDSTGASMVISHGVPTTWSRSSTTVRTPSVRR